MHLPADRPGLRQEPGGEGGAGWAARPDERGRLAYLVDLGDGNGSDGGAGSPEAQAEFEGRIRRAFGIEVASTHAPDEAAAALGADECGALVCAHLGVAVVEIPVGEERRLQDVVGERLVERERYVSLPLDPGADPFGGAQAALAAEPGGLGGLPGLAGYLRGYRDGIDAVLALLGAAGHAPPPAAPAPPSPPYADTEEWTWGLQAIGLAAGRSRRGEGVAVAVLDTGLDTTLPEFEGATVVSFVQGEPDGHDRHGHGTHTAGTACGPPRHGVAPAATLMAAKVLDRTGWGSDRTILLGLDWALAQRAQVASLSLGSPTAPGDTYSRVFERVAQRAMRQGTLIVAAAGNESRRPAVVRPVAHPANCPSILAIGAVDPWMRVAPFSNRGINPDGGHVDLAAPGVDVLSSWPWPTRRRRLSGTSMATPHVAGAAALLAESLRVETGTKGNVDGAVLFTRLLGAARNLPAPAADVGAGLVRV